MRKIHDYKYYVPHEHTDEPSGDGSLVIALVLFGIAAVALAVLVLINR